MLTSLPDAARYFDSRREARKNCRPREKVVRLGCFSRGSFGLGGRLTESGQPVGGPCSQIVVWAVVPSAVKLNFRPLAE